MPLEFRDDEIALDINCERGRSACHTPVRMCRPISKRNGASATNLPVQQNFEATFQAESLKLDPFGTSCRYTDFAKRVNWRLPES